MVLLLLLKVRSRLPISVSREESGKAAWSRLPSGYLLDWFHKKVNWWEETLYFISSGKIPGLFLELLEAAWIAGVYFCTRHWSGSARVSAAELIQLGMWLWRSTGVAGWLCWRQFTSCHRNSLTSSKRVVRQLKCSQLSVLLNQFAHMACYFLSLSDIFNMLKPTVLVGNFVGELVMYSDAADLHSVPSHFMTQAHVQNLSSHRIYETCWVSPGRFRTNAVVAVISSISCSGLFWQLIVQCDSHWIQGRLLHFYSTGFALFYSFTTVLVAVYQC